LEAADSEKGERRVAKKIKRGRPVGRDHGVKRVQRHLRLVSGKTNAMR